MDYDPLNKWHRPSGSEKKVDPATETKKERETQKKQRNSPPSIEPSE